MAWAHAAFVGSGYDGYLQLNALPQRPSSITVFLDGVNSGTSSSRRLAHRLGVDLLRLGDDEGSSRLLRGIDERLPRRSGSTFCRIPVRWTLDAREGYPDLIERVTPGRVGRCVACSRL
jgi:hypothetical protein